MEHLICRDWYDHREFLHLSTQEATAGKLWRNAQWVSSEALAKEDTLRRVPPKTQKGPRLSSLKSLAMVMTVFCHDGR
ncbi:MAG: hypothetical protein HP496_16885 [Nitrospira sp.]|nr:hypothetical protein [Nitrospira sp.]